MTDRVSGDRLDYDPDIQPPRDATLVNLLMEHMQGRLEMYEAIVPIKYICPFSPTYKPQSTSGGTILSSTSRAKST